MATKLVDVKFTKAEAKAEAAEYTGAEGPEYPWGLSIRLEDETLTKLGVTTLPDVGDEFRLVCIARVDSVSQSQMASGRNDRCVSLQITQMGIDAETDEKEASAPAPAPKASKQPTKGGVLGKG